MRPIPERNAGAKPGRTTGQHSHCVAQPGEQHTHGLLISCAAGALKLPVFTASAANLSLRTELGSNQQGWNSFEDSHAGSSAGSGSLPHRSVLHILNRSKLRPEVYLRSLYAELRMLLILHVDNACTCTAVQVLATCNHELCK